MLVLSRQLRGRARPADAAAAAAAASDGICLAPSELVHQVRELVQHEKKAQLALANFAQADLQLGAGADELLGKLVAHFERLFDVKQGAQGVLPR